MKPESDELNQAAAGLAQDNLHALQQGIEHFPTVKRLHSDVLEEHFGPIRAQVLRHDELGREAHLVDQKGISRTFAITLFPESGHSPAVQNVNRMIQAGAMIGKTFREYGFEVRKNVLEVLIVELPAWLQAAFDDRSAFAKARISEFLARQEQRSIELYGTVIEIYHPDFRRPSINDVDRLQEAPNIASLLDCGVSPNEIWQRIATNAAYDRQDLRYKTARRIAQRPIFFLKEKLFTVLQRGD